MMQNFQDPSAVHNIWKPCEETEANDIIKVLEMTVRNLKAEKKCTEARVTKLELEIKEKNSVNENYRLQNENLSKALEKEIEYSKVVKRVINTLNTDASKNKSEIFSADKSLKAKDKEIFNLERKSENQNDTIGRQKVEIRKLKDEIKKVEKHVKVKVPRKNSGEFPKVASKVIQDITNNNNAEKVPTGENVEKSSPNTALESEPLEIEPAVKVSNRFQVLVDINDEPRLESASFDQKILTPGFIGSSCSPANQPFTSSSSAATTLAARSSSSKYFQERIQCVQCARRCVDKRDMESHIFLWHTEWRNAISKKETLV